MKTSCHKTTAFCSASVAVAMEPLKKISRSARKTVTPGPVVKQRMHKFAGSLPTPWATDKTDALAESGDETAAAGVEDETAPGGQPAANDWWQCCRAPPPPGDELAGDTERPNKRSRRKNSRDDFSNEDLSGIVTINNGYGAM